MEETIQAKSRGTMLGTFIYGEEIVIQLNMITSRGLSRNAAKLCEQLGKSACRNSLKYCYGILAGS